MSTVLSNWYVLHTYSGYENKVKNSLEKLIESNSLHDYILEIVVPTHETIEKSGNKIKKVSKKVYPGYVFVKMIMSDEMWYRVRNIRGVTGFVGPTGKEAVPLDQEEIRFIESYVAENQDDLYKVGNSVKIKSGILKGKYVVIREVDNKNKRIKASIDVIGNNIVEIDFCQLDRLWNYNYGEVNYG